MSTPAYEAWCIDDDGTRWYVDKNGKSMRYQRYFMDDDGKRYELLGTGMVIPGYGKSIPFWSSENKLVYRDPKTMRACLSEDQQGFLHGLVTFIAVMCVASFLKIVGAL